MIPARRRLTAWIAILAMLWGAFAPGLARAVVGATAGAPWADICSANPVSPPDGITAPDGGTQSHGGNHCPWCVNHAGGFALPATGIFPTEFPASAVIHLAPPDDHRRPQTIVALPPARAPPAFS